MYNNVKYTLKIFKAVGHQKEKYYSLELPEVPNETTLYHSLCHKDFTKSKSMYEKKYNEMMQNATEVEVLVDDKQQPVNCNIPENDDESTDEETRYKIFYKKIWKPLCTIEYQNKSNSIVFLIFIQLCYIFEQLIFAI